MHGMSWMGADVHYVPMADQTHEAERFVYAFLARSLCCCVESLLRLVTLDTEQGIDLSCQASKTRDEEGGKVGSPLRYRDFFRIPGREKEPKSSRPSSE